MTVNKILCVDDVAADLLLIQKLLSGSTPQVLTATGGKDAIARAKADKPDLIFWIS
jgi:CheY-like chemotaxis protein